MDINLLILNIVILAPPILFALTVHELAHGYVAYSLGDPTAKDAGRLTMNPLKHLDPLGFLAFFIIKIGWAKPVPVNPRYFRNPQKDMLLVAIAGPGVNVMVALVSAILVKLLVILPLIPLAVRWPLLEMLEASVWINIVLAVFNCLPIPPLDGSRVLMGLLPPKTAQNFVKMEPYGFILVLILYFTGILSGMIMPVIHFSNNLLLG